MRQHLWVLWHVLIALAVGLAFSTLKLPPKAVGFAVGLAAAATVFLAVICWKGNHPSGYLKVAIDVTRKSMPNPLTSPPSAISPPTFRRAPLSWLTSTPVWRTNSSNSPRTVPVIPPPQNWLQLAGELEQAGALPYLLTSATVPLPAVFVDIGQNRTVYACTPAAQAAAGRGEKIMPDPMIERVRRALGRSQPLKDPPLPPEISDSVARLAPRDANLVDLFAASAVAAKFHLDQASAEQIGSRLVEFLQLHQCRQSEFAFRRYSTVSESSRQFEPPI